MAACTPVSFSLAVEQHTTTTQTTASEWTDFSQLSELISGITATAQTSPYDQDWSHFLQMDPILDSRRSSLVEYLASLDDYDDSEMAKLVSETKYISSKTMNNVGGVNFPEFCILSGYPQTFDALHRHHAFGLACTRDRSVLQVAVDDTFADDDFELPADHPCAHLPKRDMFIGIALLDFIGTDENWRDYLDNDKFIERVAAVEAQLSVLPKSRL